MNVITNIEDLEGKTIIKAFNDYEELGLAFSDNSFCVFKVDSYYGDSIEIDLKTANEIEDYDLLNLNLISQEEYEKRKEEKKQTFLKQKEEQERKQYKKLKLKYSK